MTALKKFLLGLMLFGAVTYFGGGGAFASFSAETSNNGSTVASGTLTMSDTANGSPTGCLTVSTSNNVNPGCAAVLTLTNVAPGIFGGTGKIVLQNTGSIDASKLSFWASSSNATLNGALTAGVAVTSLTVSGLEGTVASGDTIVVSFGPLTDTFVANGAGASASNGATSIPVVSHAPVSSYSVGATVTDTTSNSTVNNTDCYDVKTTQAGTVGATKGTDLNFNPATGNPLCASLLIYIQEITGGNNYCWVGNGSASVNGQCTAPTSVTLTTALTTSPGLGSLAVTALNGNVHSGDSIAVSSGSHTQTFTVAASSDRYIGAAAIPILSATPNFAYPIGSTVIDTMTLGTLNADSTDTITNFATGHHSAAGRIFAPPLLANGSIDTNAPVQLGHAGSSTDTRTFIVGVYMPAPAGQNQNPLQGLSSTFGITWHIDQ